MYSAKAIAATGLRNQQTRIDNIANNVANVNTVGYKTARLCFRDAMYTTGLIPASPRSGDESQQKGHGVTLAGVTRCFRPGALTRTERDLDLAIEGEGFFTLQNPTGELVYSRSGNFHISAEADGAYIVNADGMYLLDVNGDRIRAPLGATTIVADPDNTIRFLEGDQEMGRATLGIYTFRNLMGLTSVGSGNFVQTPTAGERLQAEVVIRQGMLEGSNVDLGEEMTRLIRTQRAFQLASRALTTADDMEGIANNMKR